MRVIPLLVMLTLPALPGCATTEPASDPLSFEQHWTLQPGAFAEADLLLLDGDRIESHFNASAPIGWDVHGHDEGGTLVTYETGRDADHTIDFEPPGPGMYSLSWSNANGLGVVELHVTIVGYGTLRGEYP